MITEELMNPAKEKPLSGLFSLCWPTAPEVELGVKVPRWEEFLTPASGRG